LHTGNVLDLAKEFQVDVSVVIACMAELGVDIESGHTSIPEELELELRQRLMFSRPGDSVSSSSPRFQMGHLVFGKYELLETTSEGGLAKVVKALDRSSTPERFVAVKVVADQQDLVVTQGLFEQEVKSLKKLQGSRNIVTLIDSGFDKALGKYCIVLEWLEQTLDQYLEANGAITNAKLWSVITNQIMNGVEDAHKRGIEHRDLKPANIMIRNSNESDFKIALIDLGIAKQYTEDANPLGTLADFRTPVYSPDNYATANQYARDIHAIAVVMLRMLRNSEYSSPQQVAEDCAALKNRVADFANFASAISDALNPLMGRSIESVGAFRERLKDAQYSNGNHQKRDLFLMMSPAIRDELIEKFGAHAGVSWLMRELNTGPTYVLFRKFKDTDEFDLSRVTVIKDDIALRLCEVPMRLTKTQLKECSQMQF
jgi:serine/threonine protein kinase